MSDFAAYVASKIESGTDVQEFTPSQVGGETFIVGDFVVWDGGNDTADRAGADPTAILGISEVDSEVARRLTPNGRVPIRMLSEKAILALSCNTTLTVAAHLLNEYGITRNAAGRWQLDVGKTGGSARCVVVALDITSQIAYVKMLAEFLNGDGIDS